MFRTFTLALLLSYACFSCQNSPADTDSPDVDTLHVEQEEPQSNESIMTEVVFNDSIDLPASWTLIGEASGDLNKDELAERVLIVQAAKASEDAAPERRIRIYQRGYEAWSLWQEVAGGVLPADAGGMLGDPFQEVSIERSCIVLNHFGGSRIRWNYTHRYRWQNEAWEMIGATVVYGAPCDYWHEFDYNLSTGKVVGKIETEDCEKDSSTTDGFEFTHQTRPLPTMEKYEPGTTAVVVPGRDLTFYF